MKKLVMFLAVLGFTAMSFAQEVATTAKPAKKHHKKHHKTEMKKAAVNAEMAPVKK